MKKPSTIDETEVEETSMLEVNKPTASIPPKQSLITEFYGTRKPDAPKKPVVTLVQKPKEEELDLSSVGIGYDEYMLITAIGVHTDHTGDLSWCDLFLRNKPERR